MECFQGTDHYGVLSSSGTLPRDIKYLPKWCGGRGNLVSLFLIHTGKTVFLGRLYLLYQLCEFRQIVCKSSARMFQKAQPPPFACVRQRAKDTDQLTRYPGPARYPRSWHFGKPQRPYDPAVILPTFLLLIDSPLAQRSAILANHPLLPP